MSTEYNAFQTMMTLAQLSALAPNPRPSGESVAQHSQRILTGINATLANSTLATAGLWRAVWLGMSPDGGNVCCIAACPSRNAFAVAVRGTQFNSLVDLGEDLAVSKVVQFTPGKNPLLVSQGAMKSFTDMTGAQGVPSGNLVQALALVLQTAAASPQPTVYITGHSLGGAMATMIALYLAEMAWTNAPAFAAYTFAAPTAGLQSFANEYDSVMMTAPNTAWRVYNQWDAVPYGWADLPYVEGTFYPSPEASTPDNPGPYPNTTVRALLATVAAMPGANVYVQTNGNSPTGQNTQVLNSDYSTYETAFTHTTTVDFLGQIGFQHNCYLRLLGAPALPAAGAQGGPPQVISVYPNNGPAAGGATVVISGGYFTPDCVVDFGNVPAVVLSIVSYQIVVVQPAMTGAVDVKVTNLYGTSATATGDQFAAPPPAAPTVVALSPTGGPTVGEGDPAYAVTVTGTGFVAPSAQYSVTFGGTPGTGVSVLSLTEISVTPPATGSGTVDVQVTNFLGKSAVAPPGDQFLLGAPIVTGVKPSSSPAKGANKGPLPTVTISGMGFIANCTVSFGNNAATNVHFVSNTTLTATPPDTTLVAGKYNATVDVTVTNPAGQTSEVNPNDEYMYYPPAKSA